jgi:hypothetical protein
MLNELIKQQYAQMRGVDEVVNDTSKPVVWVTKKTIKAANRPISYQSKFVTEHELMGLKRCPKCRHIKKLDCFSNNSKTKDGKSVHCRECNKAYFHEYHELRKRKANK